MLYYEKDLKNPKQVPRSAFDTLWRFLDLRPFINYTENRKQLVAWNNKFSPGPPDLAAAAVAHLTYRGWLDKTIIIEQGLRYCRTILEDSGYEETALYDIDQHINKEENNVILVFGCQGHEVRDRRAAAAFHILKRLTTVPLKVVFSGHHPAEQGSKKTVLTNNEARKLEREFSRLVDQDPEVSKRRNFTIALENKSASTKENLKNFLDGDYLLDKKVANLFLVSSTFHLPRLSSNAEELIAADLTKKPLIQRLYLIGSEVSPNENPVSLEAIYIKAMMFEVFHHLFKNAPFSIERPGAYEGSV